MMKSFKFGNLAVLALSVVVLLIMITFTLGAAARSSSSSSSPAHSETSEHGRYKRSADNVNEDDNVSNFDNGDGSRRKEGNRRGGKRRGEGKRRRDGLEEELRAEKLAPAVFNTSCQCGQKLSTRLIGGKNATMNAFPWQVALVKYNTTFLCGGTLINNHYVLTAAHCVANITNTTHLSVRLHEFNLTNPADHINMTVSKIIVHEGYASPSHRDDIALLKLTSNVTFPGTPLLTPVCLPSNKSKLYSADMVFATGWGAKTAGGNISNILQVVQLQTETNANCQAAGFTKKEIRKTMICAGLKRKAGTCNGDDGGPLLYLTKDGRYEQIGIASFDSVDCGTTDKIPSVFTRVTKYLHWIQMNTQNATYCSGFTFGGKILPTVTTTNTVDNGAFGITAPLLKTADSSGTGTLDATATRAVPPLQCASTPDDDD